MKEGILLLKKSRNHSRKENIINDVIIFTAQHQGGSKKNTLSTCKVAVMTKESAEVMVTEDRG